MRITVAALAACALLNGCPSAPLRPIAPIPEGEADGIVVLSITHDQIPGAYIAYPEVHMDGRPGGAKKPDYRVLESRERAWFFDFKPSEIEGAYGSVLALRLPAGAHSLETWEMWHGRPRNNPVRPGYTAPLEFTLKAGEVVYLGNLHFKLTMGSPGAAPGPNVAANAIASAAVPLFGVEVVRAAFPEIRDERARDVALFEKRYPELRGKIVPGLLKIGPW